MEITETKKRFELLKRIYGKTYCSVPDLARELKARKTDLMDFIEQNPKLFRVEDKQKGVIILDVFLKPEDNYTTEEWLEKQIKDNERYIHISEVDDYGKIVGYYINLDASGSRNYNLWRNTKEKIEFIQTLGLVYPKTFYLGFFGDSYHFKVDCCIPEENIKKLEDMGWSHNTLHPLYFVK